MYSASMVRTGLEIPCIISYSWSCSHLYCYHSLPHESLLFFTWAYPQLLSEKFWRRTCEVLAVRIFCASRSYLPVSQVRLPRTILYNHCHQAFQSVVRRCKMRLLPASVGLLATLVAVSTAQLSKLCCSLRAWILYWTTSMDWLKVYVFVPPLCAIATYRSMNTLTVCGGRSL